MQHGEHANLGDTSTVCIDGAITLKLKLYWTGSFPYTNQDQFGMHSHKDNGGTCSLEHSVQHQH